MNTDIIFDDDTQSVIQRKQAQPYEPIEEVVVDFGDGKSNYASPPRMTVIPPQGQSPKLPIK